MQHSNGVSITDSKRLPRAASADARVPQADGCAESSRLRYAGLARSLDVNGEQRCRPLGARPARLPVDGVRLIARRRDSRVCAHEPPRPAATPLKVPATVACGGSAEQGVDGNRAKRNPGPIPANPHGHGESADSGTVRRDCKSREFPFSDETAAAPHDPANSAAAASDYHDMEPERNSPPPAAGHLAPEKAASRFDLRSCHVAVHMAECVHVRTAADVALPAEPDKEDRR